MKKSTLIGLAGALMPGRKYKFLFVGLQFAYIGYQMLKNRNKPEGDNEEA